MKIEIAVSTSAPLWWNETFGSPTLGSPRGTGPSTATPSDRRSSQ